MMGDRFRSVKLYKKHKKTIKRDIDSEIRRLKAHNISKLTEGKSNDPNWKPDTLGGRRRRKTKRARKKTKRRKRRRRKKTRRRR